MNYLNIEGREIRVTNLDKVLWPEEALTKGHMIEYYIKVSSLLLSHVFNRLMSAQRFPDGIDRQGFYQKNCPEGAPDWVETYNLKRDKGKETNYILVQNLSTLVWMANTGVIEFHPWLSSVRSLDNPDFAVFDLDPMERFGIEQVIEIAAAIGDLLGQLKLQADIKTSGSTGLQVFVPLEPVYTYKQVRDFVQLCCNVINRQFPEWTTMERNIRDRQGKIYLDYMQNAREKTIVAAYSLRPRSEATYSAPLRWEDVYNKKVNPKDYTLAAVLNGQQPLPWMAGIGPQRLETAADILGKIL